MFCFVFDKKECLHILKRRHSGRMHRRTFPDLERGGGGGVSADSKSLVVKHKYSLGQITGEKKNKKTKKQQKIIKLNFVRRYRVEQNVALIDQ